jgi:predicted metal-dependent hydrolase
LQQCVIKYKEKVWIAKNSALQTRIIAALHSTVLGGHSGAQSTYHRVKKLFHWKGLKSDVENFVKQYQTCHQAKHSKHILMDCYNLYLFPKECGKSGQWIS